MVSSSDQHRLGRLLNSSNKVGEILPCFSLFAKKLSVVGIWVTCGSGFWIQIQDWVLVWILEDLVDVL